MKYLVLFVLLLCSVSVNAQENDRYINVNGTSELILPADQINFGVQIRTVAESLDMSKSTNDKYLGELKAILKETGINQDDIEISPVTLGKNYEYDAQVGRRQKGFYTECRVTFILKDFSKYYELTDKLSASSHFEVVSSGYSLSDYEQHNKKAYEKALLAAKDKAEYMAKTLGVKLGEVLEIDENNFWQNNAVPFNTVAKVSTQDENVSGKVTISKSVRVKFSIN